MRGAEGTDRHYWEQVGQDWITRGPQRLWRSHSDAVSNALVERWLPHRDRARVLKTDLFDEAVGAGLQASLSGKYSPLLGLDIAGSVARCVRERRDLAGWQVAQADVRTLPCRDDSLDAIVSLSTLDHFDRIEDLRAALEETRRVLRPGGVLLLTMDNAANPFVGVRNRLPPAWLHRLGVLPYHVGTTCRPDELSDLLRRMDLLPIERGAVLHCPRVLAVAISRLVARLPHARLHALWLRCLLGFERMERWPTRFLSGHYVAVLARKPDVPSPRVGRTHSTATGPVGNAPVRIGGVDLLPEASQHGDNESRRAAAYLLPLVPDGAPALIDNARVQMRVATVAGRLVPLVIARGGRSNSEVCDLRTHYLDYVPMQHARRGRLAASLVSRLRNAPARVLFTLGGLNRVVYANNFLFSTNPRVGLDEEALRQLTRRLLETYPRRAIVFRSINPTSDGATYRSLQNIGYEMIRSRTVLLADPSDPCTLRRHNNVKDRRLLRKTPYRVLTDQTDLLRHTVRIAQLYRGLYLGKHPGHNAAYNERFFAHAISARVWEFFAFELDGRIDAFASYFIDRDYLVGAVIGYDLSRPRSAGLYRLIVAHLLSEAATRGLQFHMSSGAADFKMLRGGVPHDEFDAVYDRHMPRRFRAACRYLRWASNRQATPLRNSS